MIDRRASSPSMAERGFTLVELLVVLLIIGLGIAVVALSVDDNRGQQLLTDARRFANETAAVADGAVFDPQPWGAQIYREGEKGEERIAWRWLHFGDKGWALQTPPDLEAGGEFGPGVEAVLLIDGEERLIAPLPKSAASQTKNQRGKPEPIAPDLWLASGEAVPFALQLRLGDGETVAVVRGDLLGRVSLEAPDEQ